ncbi:PspC domain-containing protein [Actinoplanes sp. NPDC026619]|uniref:PspC domain-containing protein n=1 Tax=Actinoplanes sp. NPDC026619 TaxID=3155798 RepID=UPI0033FB24A7
MTDDPINSAASAASSDSASAPTTEQTPPTTTGPAFSREHLVRPRQGRYVAGVCAAMARATNTDPVLWRVLVAVLGVLSGVGVLLYLIGWLIIPAEGDTASPIESLLGRGRSGMAPLSVVLLGAAAVISFGFIVNDGMRASLLAAAVILGAVLLIKRGNGGTPATFPPPPPAAEPPVGFPTSSFPTAEQPVAAYAPAGFASSATTAAPATEPVTEPPLPPRPPFSPPPSGYRPPFAPHGPWAGPTQHHQGHPLQQPRPPKPPKPPRERSKLGRLTFFAVIVVIGTMAAIDTAGASIAVSAYFAAALITIALGLIVGAWFGRARGLIALAVLTSIGLFVSNGVERWGGDVGNSVYRPETVAAVADRYDFTAGNATLDLRAIDFKDQSQLITMTMKVGQMRVLLPPNVDTVADVKIDGGRAVLFGHEFTGDRNDTTQTVTDLGSDGTGGGTLKLDLQMDTGNVEVLR